MEGGSDSDENNLTDKQSDGLRPDQYEDSYRRYESIVEDRMRNLTRGGAQYEDKKGNKKGIVDSDFKGYAYVGHQMGMKEAQKKMREIRLEAEKHGVYIVQSKWETATASF